MKSRTLQIVAALWLLMQFLPAKAYEIVVRFDGIVTPTNSSPLALELYPEGTLANYELHFDSRIFDPNVNMDFLRTAGRLNLGSQSFALDQWQLLHWERNPDGSVITQTLHVGSADGALADGAFYAIALTFNKDLDIAYGPDHRPMLDTAMFWFKDCKDCSWFRTHPLVFTGDFEITHYRPPVVPEPQTYVLMLIGLGAIGLAARRRRA